MISDILTTAPADALAAIQTLPETMAHVGQKIHETITGVPVFAGPKVSTTGSKISVDDGGNVDTGTMWKSFGNQLVNIFNGIRPFVIGLVVVALIVEAIGCIIGGEQSRQRFKQALPWIIGASILIMMALTVAQGIVNGATNNFAPGDANPSYRTTPAAS